MSWRAERSVRLRVVLFAVALLGCVGCRNQTVSVRNDSPDAARVSVARSWTGVLDVPSHGQGELKARLRPGVVEVAIERGGFSSAFYCSYQAGQPQLFVHIADSGKVDCGNSPAGSSLP